MSSARTTKMTAIVTMLSTAFSGRVVGRTLKDFSQHKREELIKGIYTVIAGPEGDYPNDVVQEMAHFGKLKVKILFQIEIDEKTSRENTSAVEDAENLAIDEIKSLMNTLPAGIDSLVLKNLNNSEQLEAPYGWVMFSLELDGD